MTELRIVARCALILAGSLACAAAGAQVSAGAAPSSASASAADRAQKESDRTLYWIRVLAEKPAPKATAPKAAVAAAPQAAKPAAVAGESRPAEHVKVAASGEAQGTNGASNSSGVVAAPAAATAPSVALPAGTTANPAAMATSGGLDAGVAGPAVAGGIAAPALTAPPPVDIPSATPEVEEPDPGLIMTKSADPQFPMAAMKRLRKGEVEVRFEVGADGQVDVVSVVKTTNPSLNDAALNAVRQWQFKPTPHGHTAVVDLAFNLDA